ncbi:hypothetical protein [Nonomuraea sp. bgisy101]|uniref:hypothetical protein n=1 Tax=Nonomuraea sp. bgisy101 TaxID=3413784 RepID=UPI003D730BD0
MTAFAADDVWVAGVDYGDDERPSQVTLPHYNGRRWARDCRDGGGEICGDGFTITRVPTTSRLLLAGGRTAATKTRPPHPPLEGDDTLCRQRPTAANHDISISNGTIRLHVHDQTAS